MKLLQSILESADQNTVMIIKKFAKKMLKLAKKNINNKDKYRKIFTQAEVMQKQALEIQSKGVNKVTVKEKFRRVSRKMNMLRKLK
jgi:cell fate (sporulation/competence/biofilm development) regulator YlbF (YheA/YmcA/DUF963 family)